MNNYRRCCRTKLLLLLLSFFVSTVSVYAEQPENESARNRVLEILEVLDPRKGILSSFTLLATSLFSVWIDLKASIDDERELVEFIFWPQQEELEEY